MDVSAKVPVDEEATWWNVRALRVLVDDDVAIADISMKDARFLQRLFVCYSD